MRIVVAPDKYAGTLSAVEAARAISDGWRRQAPDDELILCPMADGGPGFLDVLHEALGGELVAATVRGPLGEPVPAGVLVVDGTAYLESAQACGLHLVAPDQRDPETASTYGVGELLDTALDAGVDRIVVGLGGSATNDAGAGLLAALGATADGDLAAGTRGLEKVTSVDLAPARARLDGIELVVASDVDNPLLGLFGATNVYGPQKGLADERKGPVDAVLDGFVVVALGSTPAERRPADAPGAGAAGGLGFGLFVLGGTRCSGIELVADAVRLADRAGCDAAVGQCLSARLRLTDAEEEREIRAYVEEICADLPDEDLEVLGYYEFAEALAHGVASHHAGLLPTFKECVEELFSRGLIKVVFATETLALGINMPARSVVLERLTKWNGEQHVDVTPGEYTQLTGRAGRRGIDLEGHGVVLWQPDLDPRQVAGLASTRTYRLRSSFRPSYNMAVNLVRTDGRERSRRLLESSFAQFQADRAVVGLASELRRAEEGLEGYADSAQCDRGDFLAYARLRQQLSKAESRQSKRRRAGRRAQVIASLEALRPGDVIDVPSGRHAGTAVVVDPGMRSDRDGPRPLVVTTERQARRLSIVDFPTPVSARGQLRLPRKLNPRNPQSRRDLASTLRQKAGAMPPAPPSPEAVEPAPSSSDDIDRLRRELEAHPCHDCPDREDHARWAERHLKLARDTDDLRRRIEQRTGSIARQFDRVCEVLDALAYLDGDMVTPDGQRLARLYNELDLVAAECLRRGVWDDLAAPELAACLSGLVYETRNPDEAPPPRLPRGPIRDTAEVMSGIWSELDRLERSLRVRFLRQPDFGFAWAAYQWAQGAPLDRVLMETDLAAGDFVRAVKQLLDVTDQVADAAGDGELRTAARAASDALRRGVVAYTSLAATE